MSIDYAAIGPEIVVTTAACLVLVLDLVLRSRARYIGGVIALLATAVALVLVAANAGAMPRRTLSGLFVLDGFSTVFKGVFLVAGAFTIWISIPPMRGHRYEGEYYFLLLCSILGTMLMPSSRELLMLFVSLELVSVPAFVIAGLRKRNPRSNEAALKFFLIGVLSAGVLVYGISLVYGVAGSTRLDEIARVVAAMPAGSPARPMILTGAVFLVAAFGFKVSAVPFHFWAPDTYEGAPTPLAAFLSVASKAAGFVGLALILLVGFAGLARQWSPVLAGLAIATMTVGNVLALKQRHLVRLLAYSSIAHAGYMLIPLAVLRAGDGSGLGPANAEAIRSLAIYVAMYAMTNLGAFAVAVGLSKQYPTLLIRDLAGLARRAPMPAMALAAFMISLGGVPPFAVWFGKFSVFLSAVNAGSTTGIVLAAAMVVNSVVSLYYYLGIVRTMYLQEPDGSGTVGFPRPLAIGVALCFAAVVVLGVFPEPIAGLGAAARVAFLP